MARDSTIDFRDQRRVAWRPWELARPWRALGDALVAQRQRWVLGLPVALALGIALYHRLAVEPPVWSGGAAALGAGGAALLAWRATRLGHRALLVGLALGLLGFALALAQAHRVAAPRVTAPQVAVVTGVVELVEPADEGGRLTLRVETVDGGRGAPPQRVRIAARSLAEFVHVGDRVRARARLLPPSEPVLPGAFDFARWAHFQGLGAVGYTLGGVEVLSDPEAHPGWRVAEVRRWIAARVVAGIPGDAGAVAAALTTGLRGDIPDHVWAAMQGAGLAHLLAISGLHVGLVAGTTFLVVRYGICLWPWLALRVQAHRVAAIAGLVMAIVYLLLAGATVPTQRAVFMTGVVLLALLLDRAAISLRLVAAAALVILAIDPAALFGASFQMSFGAVVALVAAYERWRWQRRDRDAGTPGLLVAYVLGVAVTTVIASAATTPFAAYHFGRIPTYGILANLVAVPLMAFWIMPLALLALALMPLGWDGPALQAMRLGVEGVLWSAEVASGWPMAAIVVPQPPGAAVALLSVGVLWCLVWRARLARLGALPAAAALAWIALARPPDLVVDRGAGMAALRGTDGRYALAIVQRDGFVLRGWSRALGITDFAPPGEVPGVGCDERGCRLRHPQGEVAVALRPNALALDCSGAAALVVNLASNARCPATPTITRSDLWSKGALAARLGRRPDLRFVLQADGRRLWQRPGGAR